jgi:tetratricopeptide (TPR) repeat protein
MNKRSSKGTCIILSIAFMLAFSIVARAQAETPMQAADALFQAQKWAESAKAYEALTKTAPDNGRVWYRLGLSLLSLGEYERSVPAFQKAVEINKRPEPMYGLASSYARLNDKEKAFEWLNKAIGAGLPAAQAETDANLDSLRSDARFKEAMAAADKLAKPCAYQTEYKQLDFWVGEWTVTSNGQPIAKSSIQSIVNGCAILENYSQANGFVGKSLNFFDPNLRKWRQVWIDGTTRVAELVGEYKDGAMHYTGEGTMPDGSKLLRRMTLFNLAPDRMRQFCEASTDRGKEWQVRCDLIYTRSK